MKLALYLEDGMMQVVLTPETEFDTQLVRGLSKYTIKAEIKQGSFYQCRGGYVRQGVGEDSIFLIARPE